MVGFVRVHLPPSFSFECQPVQVLLRFGYGSEAIRGASAAFFFCVCVCVCVCVSVHVAVFVVCGAAGRMQARVARKNNARLQREAERKVSRTLSR